MLFQHGRGWFLSCKEIIHGFKENTAGGGLRFLALLFAVITTLPITFASTTDANAADSGIDAPTCSGTWKDLGNGGPEEFFGSYQSILTTYFPFIPVSGWQSCEGLYKKAFTYGDAPIDRGDKINPTISTDVTVVVRAQDDGYRLWFTAGTAGIRYGVDQEDEHYSGDPYSTSFGGVTHDGKYDFLSYAILDGAESSSPTGGSSYWRFKTSKNTMVMQIKRQQPASPTLPDDITSTIYPVFYSNGGVFADGTVVNTPWLAKNGLAEWTASNMPTRAGYTFKEWSTDQAGQHPVGPTTVTLKNGTRLYAQWEKASGEPQKVDLDCSTGGRCELTVNYSGATAKTREFQPGSGELAWSGSPVTGVRLDASGYAADGACSDTRCWYVSLDKEPNQQGAYQAQMPTTGAPDGLSSVGLVALSVSILGVALTVLRRRS